MRRIFTLPMRKVRLSLLLLDDETSVEGQTGPENSANWDTYIPAPAVIVALTQGTHKLRVDFPAGGCNFKKIVFKKIDK